ncbi:hypothetical protein H1D32_02425 [Anaerobacillus sp. CMMVII]|uniref:hypothetical protein n=1 Tax=Anaerobacillus sp. CMMVII TaxID=2755588 RepID=UPI0021B73FF7|nr:hypothetical protein [Anaerobacillus sp. CMMVII]MCT8136705.1 hypothetical protein [Anaerobacillus sp. CMMVII]
MNNINRISTTHYQIHPSTVNKALGDLFISEGQINLQYSGELTLPEYLLIHDIIVELQHSLNGKVDDSNSFLGYLPDGESVYITKNWDKWVSYIYSSMKNCKDNASYF